VADTVTPLCTWSEFTNGAFANLARQYTDPTAQLDLLQEATRLCEEVADRRLAPFTGIFESFRGSGVDPDEYTDSSNLPLDLAGTLGRSYAYALGASTLVRHCWLREYAPRYPEMWSYSNVSISIVRSYGGGETVGVSQFDGPEVDSGHVWFHLGKFIPIGSLIRVTYSGGYTVSVPASLRRAGKLMTASLVIRELQPSQQTHDPALLHDEAAEICASFGRE
jgi:hypothetical protein